MSGVFKLLFSCPKKGGRMFKPVAKIALGDHSITDDDHLITPELTESELDNAIDSLIDELEKIRKKAKCKYSKSRELEIQEKERRTL